MSYCARGTPYSTLDCLVPSCGFSTRTIFVVSGIFFPASGFASGFDSLKKLQCLSSRPRHSIFRLVGSTGIQSGIEGPINAATTTATVAGNESRYHPSKRVFLTRLDISLGNQQLTISYTFLLGGIKFEFKYSNSNKTQGPN